MVDFPSCAAAESGVCRAPQPHICRHNLRKALHARLWLRSAGAWVDRPSVDAALAVADGRKFNLQYELDGGVPLYDRALETPLSDSAAISPDVRRPSVPPARSLLICSVHHRLRMLQLESTGVETPQL